MKKKAQIALLKLHKILYLNIEKTGKEEKMKKGF
tara:strand:- start:230 stop:331 length:102 start_codon:yes stop_codon:yes gene_type:complete